jgi:tetratricopeptide (TPR) repeat protein
LAHKRILSCLKKRDLLNRNSAELAELVTFGQHYSQEGRFSDAIDFFEKAQFREGLLQLWDHCLKEGDYFLCRRVARILSLSPDPEEWVQLGDAALEQGKYRFARAAYREGDLPEKLAQVERLLDPTNQEQVKERSELH